MTSLKDKYGEWGLVTGPAQRYGLGEAFAHHLAAQGINLVLVDILGEELQTQADRLSSLYGVEVLPVTLDLGRDDMLPELVKAVSDLEIDVLVCNHYEMVSGEFMTIDAVSHIDMMHANARAYLLLAHYFGREMVKRGKGAIILVSSLAAIMPIPYNVSYSSFKAYQLAMAEALSGELKPLGVDVIGLVGPFMNTADARKSGLPQFLLADTSWVVKKTFRNLGKRSRLLPGFISRLILLIFTQLLGRTRGTSLFGRLVWEKTRKILLKDKTTEE
ncbi:MAG: SDR family NAD(P)-dependent oxidoreductase [Anaerolineae bacterium]|nr:SDR family NAD(P)-dependent oxidoreductase [Anaerolineae bacterium]